MAEAPQGHDPDIFEDADKLQEHELICSVCECVIKDAVETPCGHLFCRECVLNCLKHSPTCPIDRKELKEAELNRSVRVDRLVGRQQVHCSQKDDGCAWVGQFSDLEAHTGKKCEYIIVICENKVNGCEVQVIRKEYAGHVAECKFKLLDCQYCKIKVVEPQLKEHLLTCPNFPIECPNECKTVGINRNTLEEHLLALCPSRLIPCPYLLHGCELKVKRHELVDHLDKATQFHLELVSTKLHVIQNELIVTRRIVEEQNERIQALALDNVNSRLRLLISQLQINFDDGAESESSLGSSPTQQRLQETFQLAYDNYSNLRYTEAVSTLRTLAPKGHGDAQFLLGQCYWFGRGVSTSKLLGAKWFARAALNGQVAALNSLAACFISADPLFGEDYRFATQLWEKASNAGSESATFHLATAYKEGNGVKQDLDQAERFLKKAADSGSRRAQQQLKNLRKEREDEENKDGDKEGVVGVIKENDKEIKKVVGKDEKVGGPQGAGWINGGLLGAAGGGGGGGGAYGGGGGKDEKKNPPVEKEEKYFDREDTRASLSFGGVLSNLFGRGLSSPGLGKDKKDKKESKKIYFGEKLNTYSEFNNSATGFAFIIDGKSYPTSEHFFQCQKYKGAPDAMEEVRQMKSSMEAFSAGRTRKFSNHMRRDWHDVKETVMQQAIREKFKQNPVLMKTLLATGDAEIIRSDLTDAYWGDGGDGRGYNKLGKIIMAVRDENLS